MRTHISLAAILLIAASAVIGQPPCLFDGNKPVVPQGATSCRMPSSGGSPSSSSSSGSSQSTGFVYVPFVSELMELFNMAAADSAAAAQRRAALEAQLQAERQAAIARKEEADIKRLDDILLRLRSTLKGKWTSEELQLKMSPTGPIRFGEYMSTPATQTTGARLELKTGDEATRSLQPTTNASSAGNINPTPPSELKAPNAEAAQLSSEVRELVDLLAKLTPEQQQRIISAVRDIKGPDPQQGAVPPAAEQSQSAPEKKDDKLTLKLSDASNSQTAPEQIATDAAKDFDKMQQMKAPPVTSQTAGAPAVPSEPRQTLPTAISSPTLPVVAPAAIGSAPRPYVKIEKVVPPAPRPAGWVGPASKGERTLRFVEELQKKSNCGSAEQQQILAKLVLKSNQLADVERLINRLNAASPRLQAEISETVEAVEKDRDAFIESMISKLAEQASAAQMLMKDPAFVRDRDTVVEVSEFAENVGEYIDKIQTLKNASRDEKIELLQEMIPKLLIKLEPRKLAALKQKFGPQINFATEWYDLADVTYETIETFFKIALHGIEVKRLDREVDARNKALAFIEPLHKKLSGAVDELRHHPSLAACSTN